VPTNDANGDDDSADDDSSVDDSSDDDYGNDELADAGVPVHPYIAARRAAIQGDDVPQEAVMDENGGDADSLDDLAALADRFPMIECDTCGGAWQLREMAMPLRCPNLECQAALSTRNVRLTDSARGLLDAATKRRNRDRFSEV
jgi:hypothetical protein